MTEQHDLIGRIAYSTFTVASMALDPVSVLSLPLPQWDELSEDAREVWRATADQIHMSGFTQGFDQGTTYGAAQARALAERKANAALRQQHEENAALRALAAREAASGG